MNDIFQKSLEMRHLLKFVFTLVQLVVTVGCCTATNEHAFHDLKFIKIELRTTMVDEQLDDLMCLIIEKHIVDDMNFSNTKKHGLV